MMRQRLVHAGIAEAYDIRRAVVIDVGEFARKLLLAGPAAGLGAELLQVGLQRPERPVAMAERQIDPTAAESGDVDLAIAVDVGEFARKLVLAGPAPGNGAELRERGGERPERSVALGKRNIDAAGAEADDIRHVVAVQVGEF